MACWRLGVDIAYFGTVDMVLAPHRRCLQGTTQQVTHSTGTRVKHGVNLAEGFNQLTESGPRVQFRSMHQAFGPNVL